MDNRKVRLQRAAIFAFFIAINIFLVGFFGVPRIQALSMKAKASEANKMLALQLEADTLAAKVLERKIEGYEKTVSGLNEVVPENLDTAQLVYDFYMFSGVKGIEPVRIAFDKVHEYIKDSESGAPDSSPSRVRITFIAEGIAGNVISFVEDAKNMTEQNLIVDSIRLVDAAEGRVEAEIGFITYVRNPLPPETKYANYEFHIDNVGHGDLESMFGD
ncbi:hypothetical protein [Youngiibacter fragilis]|uniref:Uncharacterized protein n=1 Tax=Youngiibacter fragilis 232.1 TaxID=994573 RepID=V7IBG7_9CLOT|nr:hypothetical protein [Youngiibacter fragilis]ETA82212.1 hypothetical protein T472_0202415 [Youngiibacter fragilis 232.1]